MAIHRQQSPSAASVGRPGEYGAAGAAGRVTSARRSDEVGAVIGLAWVPPDRAEAGARFEIRVDRQLRGARVLRGAFFDPAGERMRS